MVQQTPVCCPADYPQEWDEREISWQEKRFVKARVRSFLHMPLNFGGVLTRNLQKIEAAGAGAGDMLVFSDENSLWGADMYIAVTRDVPGATMATLSGTFLSKVFEGPYKNIPSWIAQMKQYVAAEGKQIEHLYFCYRTCPKCAKKYGKNYVVLLAKV